MSPTENESIRNFLNIMTPGEGSRNFIDDILEKIGEYYDGDRTYIFELHKSGKYITNTFEWCREGVAPEIDNLQEVPLEALIIWYERYRNEGAFYIKVDNRLRDNDPLSYEVLHPQNIDSLMTAPLMIAGEIVGMFGVDNPRKNLDHLTLISVVAAYVHHDVQNIRLLEREETLNKELRRLNSKLEKITANQISQLKLISALSRDYLNIYVIHPERKMTSIVKLDGYITPGLSKDGAPEYEYDSACDNYINSRVYKPDIKKMKDVMELSNIQNHLKKKDSYIGIYRVLDNDEVHYYQYKYVKMDDSDDIIAGFQNADAIVESEREQKERLKKAIDDYKEADYDRRVDFLTGLRNRQDLFEMLQDVLAGNREKIISAFMMDIDNFKLLNDNYGHVCGDECLKKIGSALNRYSKGQDLVFYRYGGEEILGICFDPESDAGHIADELVKLISDLDIKRDDLPTGRVTVSVGYTIDNSRYEKMIDKADAAMYKAKELGKNRAVYYEKMQNNS